MNKKLKESERKYYERLKEYLIYDAMFLVWLLIVGYAMFTYWLL